MDADKAPGPDGLNPGFYQHFWSLLGEDVFNAARGWLEDGVFPQEIQETNIILLPKVDNVRSMKDLRPISLCNVLYRVVAKVLANRMRKVMPILISEEQSAFVRGRSIIDNVMVAFETIHSMKKRWAGKWGDVAVKIDISKVYDRVEWVYLEAVLRQMGFHERWVHWMMMCVRSVQYTVMINGEGVGPIVPSRGLRQGCPLSPFLFILCAKGLSALIRQAKFDGRIQGARVCRGAPWVTHLLFADDSFFFMRATFDEARELRKILDMYAEASGQLINYQKSGIQCSRNTHCMLHEGISAILGIHNPLDTGRYLGLPSCVGRNKRRIFSHLKDRIWKRIQVWRGRKLSHASREVLIKSVAQAIPTYFMNTFLLTMGMLEEIEKMMNSFWWGTRGNGGGGLAWMRWERISVWKEFGGIGFRDLLGFNVAMLGKQGWKLLTCPNTLVSHVYKAKYYPKGDFLSATEGSNPSFIWRSVRKT
ncbi:LINE-1 retrotransposable element ORF2 protein [Linum grandiflorum]